MTSLQSIRLNPDAEIQRQQITDDDFCVVVDDFLADPQSLIDFACENSDGFLTPEYPYPGLRMDLDARMLDDWFRFIRTRMSKQFSFLRGGVNVATGLSIVTLPPDELSNYQRVCHTDPRDVPGRRKYGSLVYLYSNEDLGGTAFYRYRDPDIVYKWLDLEISDPPAATAFLQEHTAAFRQPPCYMTESNELAELLHVVPPRFNRFVFYSGEIPHTAYIASPDLLSEDVARGRLTLNSFISVIPR